MKKLLTLCGILGVLAVLAADSPWSNLDDEHYVSGPKLTPQKFRNRVVVVERWGHQCGPCLASLPHMEQLHKLYGKKGVVFIGSHCQDFDKPDILAKVNGAGVTYSVYQWAGHAGAPAAGGIPAPYIVGVDGKVCWNDLGFHADKMEEAIKKALKASPTMDKDLLLEEIKENLETRPGYALLCVNKFIKAYPKEKARMDKAKAKLADTRTKALYRLELEVAKVAAMMPTNPAGEKKRKEAIAALVKKAQKLECPALVTELEAM